MNGDLFPRGVFRITNLSSARALYLVSGSLSQRFATESFGSSACVSLVMRWYGGLDHRGCFLSLGWWRSVRTCCGVFFGSHRWLPHTVPQPQQELLLALGWRAVLVTCAEGCLAWLCAFCSRPSSLNGLKDMFPVCVSSPWGFFRPSSLFPYTWTFLIFLGLALF